MYCILIVEDDDHAAKRLETLLERYAKEHALRFSIQREQSAFDLLEAAQEADTSSSISSFQERMA